MARALLAAIVVAAVLVTGTYAGAAGWTKLGTSGFTTTPVQMRDWQRVKFNSIAFDGAGNIYATGCNGNNNGMSGGLTIFQPNGAKIADVDLNALGYHGAITKLVTGGDGVVYGLQNWLEINWSFAQNVNRILAILPNGNVVEIWNAGSQSDANRIGGMAVGADGNIYWTTNGADEYWKYHFFWRYDVAGGYAEECPKAGTNYGWSETLRMLDLEFVGTSPDSYDFAVVSAQGGSTWRADKMSWTLGRETLSTGACNPGWGRDWMTASAYDPVNDILWVGGRGGGSGPWSYSGGGGNTFVNGEITMPKAAGEMRYYQLNLSDTATAVSAASRFKLDAYAGGYDGTILEAAGGNNNPWGKIVVSGSDYVLRDHANVLATLGPVVLGEYNTAYIAVDGTNDRVECWWNGTKKYDGSAALQTQYNWRRAFFGPSVRDGSYNGTATVVFDWVAADEKRIAPGDPMPAALGRYLDGWGVPDYYGSTNIMSYWPGNAAAGFFPQGYCVSWHANGNDPNASQRANGARYWISAIACDPSDGEAYMSWNGEANYNHDPVGAVFSRRAVPGSVSALAYHGVPEARAQTVALGFQGGKIYATTCNMDTGEYSVYWKTPGVPELTTISQAKQSYPGTLVRFDSAKLVTFPAYDGFSDYFYIEEDDRSGGIKVIPDVGQPVAKVGEKALVQGRIGVQDGEGVIFASSVVISNAGEDKIEPLGMPVRSVGGRQLGVQPPTLSGGSDSWGFPDGLNTTGLLIRVAGTLRVDWSLGYPVYHIDDGSPFPIRIEYAPGFDGNDGDTAIVTGISGVAWDGANGFRVILLRTDADVRILP